MVFCTSKSWRRLPQVCHPSTALERSKKKRRDTVFNLKPGFHIVVSVVSVVRKKFIGQIKLYGNLPYKCSIQKKRQIHLVVRDRMNSICPMNFFRTTDTTDTTIWKPGLKLQIAWARRLGRGRKQSTRPLADKTLTRLRSRHRVYSSLLFRLSSISITQLVD